MKTVRIETDRPFDVIIGYDILDSFGYALLERQGRCRVALISDHTVYALYGKKTKAALEAAGYQVAVMLVEPGEVSKTLAVVDTLLNQFVQSGIRGLDIVVGLGGGVVCDVAGTAAAVYLHGIAYAQIPTTLLAAVDAPIDGRLHLHLSQGRNMAGLHWPPRLVLCDCRTFDSLPHEIFQDGVVESLKYGVICDKSLFEEVSRGALDEDCMDIVARCVSLKSMLYASDEPYTGGRKLLNLGGTMGRAIGLLSEYTLSYGHCMSIGMAGTVRVAEALGLCVMGCAGILMAMLDRLELPCETTYTAEEMAEVASKEGLRHGNTLPIILPESIGKCVLYPVKAEALPQLFRLAKGGRL